MKMIDKLKALWKGKSVFPATKHKVKFAFKSGGIEYFELDDVFNLPYKRGLAAMSVYEELRMRCTLEYLKLHAEACNNVLSAPKFNMASALQLKKLNDQLKERLTWIVDIDVAYKLAAVVFFDKSESPEGYDPKYATEKVNRWKKDQGIDDFFLQMPLQKLIPFLRDFEENLSTYSAVVEELNKVHLENIYSNLSPQRKEELSGLQ